MLKDFLKGLLYGFLLDLAGLLLLWPASAWSLGPWALMLLWVMVALVITGIGIAEARWLIPAGFWSLQLAVFTLWLLGFIQLIRLGVHLLS